ncbi:N-acyl homoserine lactonase family protein [Thermosulfuriphilus ammonigenes]|uniref:N-acyl homoserine lactonase family protein n=1 Tax=Thermosulfuriphilus ammonigenes TaxID=1936021 RepID=A0A6G7PZ77_9BACT|nr:N-acyl homoserine lactonase family protein [Thermosulfuriphilus ammonigenes]MBA2849064.1 glyoxylase-like metal-dependent hydrolase (beta-lactamase superfamily II) [Thermosulfuriphilus ammonigenes]QIJ72748.1 N-acyl homoserine lactonase family protein [Thermosulfuriphilus ammonigenes]
MTEYTIYPLVVGANETDQGIMTYLRGYGRRIWIPIYVFVLKGADKNILIDTGLEQFVVPEEVATSYGWEILEFDQALARVGLRPEDIDIIIHTHLHNDHCENDNRCPRATVYVQRREYEFWQNPHPIDHRYYPDVLEGVREVVVIDGEEEIYSGIRVVPTPGHTAGGQTVLVNTSSGTAVITGFCCNEANFPQVGPAVAPGVHLDAILAWESAQKVREMGDILIPLHAVWPGQKKKIP